MKRIFIWIVLIGALVLTPFTFSSCDKKQVPVPDFPQLIGHWSGTTSQGPQISFWINNLSGTLSVTNYDLTVYTTSGAQDYLLYNTYGIASVINKQFKIHLGTGSAGESYIDGTFNVNDMTLNGNWAVYQPGNSVDLITGTYNCLMSN